MIPTILSRLLPISTTLDKNNNIRIADYSIAELAAQFGTPLYIFDRATIIHACQRYQHAFTTSYSASDVRIVYASKAYTSPQIAAIMREQGFGLDVVSGGEMLVAQRAQFPMERVSFHGNNKSESELRLALSLEVGRIVVDNESEVILLSQLAQELHLRPSILLRIAPEVETETHRYLQTGHASSKFGFALAEAKRVCKDILHADVLQLVGLHAHTGTMLREVRPYQECLECLLALADEVYSETKWWPTEISPGGGWGVDTIDEEQPLPDISVLAQALQTSMQQGMARIGKNLLPPTLIIEPGRSIVARAGVAVYRVGARKATAGGVTYLFVDGGMGDNIRPALYGARYTALPVEDVTRPATETMCISGRYCESGDVLIDAVFLPQLREGEALLLPTTGAYCLPMASNYNMMPRPTVILIDEKQVSIMERRETYDDMLARFGGEE
jgi:diaminopimelate decarboxylase